MSEIENMDEGLASKRENRRKGKTREIALLDWVRLTGPSAMDLDLLTFITNEIALKLKQGGAVGNWHATLIELMNDQLENGMPMTMVDLKSYQEMTRQARNAEESLLAVVFACASALNDAARDGEWVQSELAWPNEFGLRDLLRRLGQGQGDGPLASQCLGWIAAEEQRLISTDLYGANLQGAQLERVDLEGADLEDANLEGTDLFGADLSRAYVKGARLYGANLEGAKLEEANLEGALLGDVQLEGANLERAHLENAVLDVAGLKGANLKDAHLEGVHFLAADLEGAQLEGALLHGARMEEANLVGANFFRANLRKANLSNCNLEGANFNQATLEQADLRGANLEGVDLEGARSLRGTKIDPEWLERLGINPHRLKAY